MYSTHGRDEKCINTSFISLERLRHRWKDNIKMYMKKNGVAVLKR
jgi:hypothetical protein